MGIVIEVWNSFKRKLIYVNFILVIEIYNFGSFYGKRMRKVVNREVEVFNW